MVIIQVTLKKITVKRNELTLLHKHNYIFHNLIFLETPHSSSSTFSPPCIKSRHRSRRHDCNLSHSMFNKQSFLMASIATQINGWLHLTSDLNELFHDSQRLFVRCPPEIVASNTFHFFGGYSGRILHTFCLQPQTYVMAK